MQRMFLAPATSTMSFTILRDDGVPAANLPVVVQLSTLGAFGDAFGVDSRPLTTDANGVVTVDKVPNVAEAQMLVANDFFAAIIVPPIDTNADGDFDFAGTVNTIGYDTIGQRGGKVVGAILPSVNQNTFSIVASNATFGNGTNLTRPNPASSPLVFVFNKPVDPKTVSITVASDFPHRMPNGDFIYDDSTQAFGDETFPEPPFAGRSTNVLNGGSNEITVTLDQSGTIVTGTPKRAFAQGREFLVTIAAATAATSDHSPSTLLEVQSFRTIAMAPLAIESVYYERSGTGTHYANAVIELNQPIRGADELSGPISRIYGCIDADLNADGDRLGPGGAGLDKGECPSAGYALTLEDAKSSLLVLPVRRGTAGPSIKSEPGFGRFYDLNLSQPHLSGAVASAVGLDTGATTLPFKIFVNPIVSGTTFVTTGSTPYYDNQLKVLPTQVLDVPLDVSAAAAVLSQPPVGGPAVLVRSGGLAASSVSVPFGESICNDGIDNDGDGAFDCDAVSPDSDCSVFCESLPFCPSPEIAIAHRVVTNYVAPTGSSLEMPTVAFVPQLRNATAREIRVRFDILTPNTNVYGYMYSNLFFNFAYWLQNAISPGANFVNTRLYDSAPGVLGTSAAPHTGSFGTTFYGLPFSNLSGARVDIPWHFFFVDNSGFPVTVQDLDVFVCVHP